MKFTTLFKLFAFSGFTAFSVAGNAAVITFDALATPGISFSGSSLDIDGFNFSNSSQNPEAILHWGTTDTLNAQPGGATYSHNYSGQTTTMTRIGGGVFSLGSLDIGNVYNNSPYAQTFNFSADLAAGGTLTTDFTSDALPGLQTVLLGWQNISAFYFTEGSGTWLQADNFVVDSLDVSAVPLPAAFPLFGSGLALFGFLSRRRKKAAV